MIVEKLKHLLARLKDIAIDILELKFVPAIVRFLKNFSVMDLLKVLLKLVAGLVVLAIVGLFALVHYPATQIQEFEPLDSTVFLDQGWGVTSTSEQRQLYYYTPQGTSLKGLEYDWFAHLEMPWGTDKFARPEHLRAYGFIVDDKPTDANPYQFPLGFTRHFDNASQAYLLDISCAACHSGELIAEKNGKRYGVRIDGGQAMHAFTTMQIGHFVPTLVASLASTYYNPFKFDRFARNLLGENYNSTSKGELDRRFNTVLWNFLKQGYNDTSKGLYPLEEGFGRTDALARIGNTVFGDNLSAENYHLANGPVNYPPVWNIWKFNWVQYGASVKQPMARNMGEALGVGARIQFTDPYGKPLQEDERFDSGVLPENIHRIETTLQQLKAPPWPSDLFGDIDQEKADAGKILFQAHCVGCHGPNVASETIKQVDAPLKTEADPVWIMEAIGIDDIGTDPNAAYNFVNNRFNLSKTGLTDAEITATVRPIHMQQLQRIARHILKSERLATILENPDTKAADLTLKTQWVTEHASEYAQLLKRFDQWNTGHANAAGFADTIASVVAVTANGGDIDAMTEDVKTELMRSRLQAMDQQIDQLNVESLTVGEALNITGIIIREKYYRDKHFSDAKRLCMDGFGALDMPQQPLAYKARPLEGIWATPPFLHNGSVPSIYQLLSPVSERDEVFFVGRKEYDPVNLGYLTMPESDSGFWFDTSKSGNNNTGHEFRAGYVEYAPGNQKQFGVIGDEFTPEQRFQIIEYLKIHKDDAGHTPVTQSCEGL